MIFMAHIHYVWNTDVYCDQRCVFVYLAGLVTTIAGSGEGYLDGIASIASFNYPRAVCVASDGTWYVADSGNLRLRKISTEGAYKGCMGFS